VRDRPKQPHCTTHGQTLLVAVDTDLSNAHSWNAWVLLPSYSVARAVVGTKPLGRGRPNALLSVPGRCPFTQILVPLSFPITLAHIPASFSLTVESLSTMSLARVVATTQVVPFLPCGRRQARIIPAAVAYAYRVLDPWHTFSQSGSYTSPRNSGGECLEYRLFLVVAIKHGWNLQVKDVQWYQADTRGQFKVMYT